MHTIFECYKPRMMIINSFSLHPLFSLLYDPFSNLDVYVITVEVIWEISISHIRIISYCKIWLESISIEMLSIFNALLIHCSNGYDMQLYFSSLWFSNSNKFYLKHVEHIPLKLEWPYIRLHWLQNVILFWLYDIFLLIIISSHIKNT